MNDSLFPSIDDTSPQQFIAETGYRAGNYRQLARTGASRDQQAQNFRYDDRHFLVAFSPGTESFGSVHTPGLSEKLMRRYIEPYRILRATSICSLRCGASLPQQPPPLPW